MPSSDGATKRQISPEALNFIERHPGPLASKNNETNLYSFKGLIAAATPYAKEALEVRAQAAKAKRSGLKARSRSSSSTIRRNYSLGDLAPFSIRAGR